MLKKSLAPFALALAVLIAPATVSAQAGPRFDRLTVAGLFGGLSGAASLNEAGTAEWQLGWAAAVNATFWPHENIGLRIGGGWAQDSIQGSALSGRPAFNKFTYDADLVLRYPIGAGAGTLVPYAFGGAGAISVHQLGSDSTWTKFAGNFGAGLEYRLGRIGVRAEARDHVYAFDRYGFNRTQHDIAWQGGVTLSF